jgi:hypothetical protein
VVFDTPEVKPEYMLTLALYKNEQLIQIIDNGNIEMDEMNGFTCTFDTPIGIDGNYTIIWSMYQTLFQRKRGPRTDISDIEIVMYNITNGTTISNDGNLEVGKDYDYRLFVTYSNGERIDATTAYDRLMVEHSKIYNESELENVSKVGLFTNEPRKVRNYIGKVKATYTDPTILTGRNTIEGEFIFHAFAGTGILTSTILKLSNTTLEKDNKTFDFFAECSPLLEGIYKQPDNRVIFNNEDVVYRFYRNENEISVFDITRELGVVLVHAYKQTDPSKYAEYNLLVTENTTSIFDRTDLYFSTNNGTSLFPVLLDSDNKWYHKPFVLRSGNTVTFWLKLTYKDGTAPKWVSKKVLPDLFSAYFSSDPDWENQDAFKVNIDYRESSTNVNLEFDTVLTYQLVLERLELMSNHEFSEFNLQKSCDPCNSTSGCQNFIVPYNSLNQKEIQLKAYFNNGFTKLYDLDDDSVIVKYGTLGDLNLMTDLNLNNLPESLLSVISNIWINDPTITIANKYRDIYCTGTFNIIPIIPKMIVTNYQPVSSDDYLTLQFNEHPILDKGLVVSIPMQSPYNSSACERIIDSSSPLEEIRKVKFLWTNPLTGNWEDLYEYDDANNRWVGRLEAGLAKEQYNDVKVTYDGSEELTTVPHVFINLELTDYGITNKIVSLDSLVYDSTDTVVNSTQQRNITSFTDIKCQVTLDNGQQIYIKPDRVLPLNDLTDFINHTNTYQMKSARVIIDFNKTVNNLDMEWHDSIAISVQPAYPISIFNINWIDASHPGAIQTDPIFIPYTFDVDGKDSLTFTVKYSDGLETINQSNNLQTYQDIKFVPNSLSALPSNYEASLVEYVELEFTELHEMVGNINELKRTMADFDMWMTNIEIPTSIAVIPNKLFELQPIVANEYIVDISWDSQIKFAITNYNANFTYSLDWSNFKLWKVTSSGLDELNVNDYLSTSQAYEFNASGDRLFINIFWDRSKFINEEVYKFEMRPSFVNAYFINTTSGHRHDITNISTYTVPYNVRFTSSLIKTGILRMEYLAPSMFRFIPIQDIPTTYTYYQLEEQVSGKLITFRNLEAYSVNENTVGSNPTIHDILPAANVFSLSTMMHTIKKDETYKLKFYDTAKNLVKTVEHITWDNDAQFIIIE